MHQLCFAWRSAPNTFVPIGGISFPLYFLDFPSDFLTPQELEKKNYEFVLKTGINIYIYKIHTEIFLLTLPKKFHKNLCKFSSQVEISCIIFSKKSAIVHK